MTAIANTTPGSRTGRKLGLYALAGALFAAGFAGVPALTGRAAAQAVSTGNDNFNIPENFQVMGNANPNERRATARVNGSIVTGTDVEQRMALILAANRGVDFPADELERLRLQVLRNLIDETIQIQEAAAQEMAVEQDEVDGAYQRYAAGQLNMSTEQLGEYLASIGSSPRSLKRQIQGELAWDRLLRRNVEPFVNVSSSEVTELFEQLQQSRGTFEYRIGEIFLSANSTNQQQVLANANQIVEQLRQGGSFVAYARQFSEASTKAVGGDLGWIRLEQLQNPQLETAAAQMLPGQLVGPVEIPGGYSILLLIDRRQVGMADPRDALLSLKQISLNFAPGTTPEAAQARADAFAAAVQGINGCGDADAKAAAIGATTVDNDQIAVRALPEALQNIVLGLSVGQATPPFGSLEEGVRVLILCGRDDPPSQNAPDYDTLMNQLETERVNRRAQRYLRDLRRDAVIEYN